MGEGTSSRTIPFPAFLALRYLKSTRKDSFVTFLSVVAAGGLAVGVAILILSLAAISGFQSVLRAEILARTPQIEVEVAPEAEPAAVREAVAGVAGIVSAQVVAHGSGWLVADGKVQAVELVGFEGTVPPSFPDAAGKPPGLYIPSSLATRWGVRPGDPVAVVSPRPTLTPLGPQPRLRTVPLAGTYRSGRTQEDRERAALPLAVAATLLGPGERRIEASAADLDAAVAAARRVAAAVPSGCTVRTWQDLNRPLLFALRLEKAMMFVAVSLIVLVAAFALVADLALIIASKRAEIGVLGTLGATPSTLRRAFVLLGGLISGLGVAVGTLFGAGGAWLLDRFHLVRVPGQVYFIDYVPFLVLPADLGLVLAVTVALALAAAAYAAQRAAALDPLEAMR